jgi:hypothetical protein
VGRDSLFEGVVSLRPSVKEDAHTLGGQNVLQVGGKVSIDWVTNDQQPFSRLYTDVSEEALDSHIATRQVLPSFSDR